MKRHANPNPDKEPRFVLTANGDVVGWSRLEYGDPPMGVVWGRLILDGDTPKPSDWDSISLTIHAEGGEALETTNGGVFVEDLSAEVGPECIEVRVLGLERVFYERHFPHHIKAYEDRFDRK